MGTGGRKGYIMGGKGMGGWGKGSAVGQGSRKYGRNAGAGGGNADMGVPDRKMLGTHANVGRGPGGKMLQMHANVGRGPDGEMPGTPIEGSTGLTHVSGLVCLPDHLPPA